LKFGAFKKESDVKNPDLDLFEPSSNIDKAMKEYLSNEN
jgi:hypothetical protein